MTQLLQDKVAVITGASNGIGAGIARVFAREGAHVVVNYRSSADGAEETAAAVREQGREALVVQADVSRSGDVDRLFGASRDEFGRVDVLVNNAGVTTRCAFLESDESFFDTMMGTDLKGVYLCSRRVASMMKEQGAGRILNISSVHSVQTSHDFSIYAAAKGGVDQLTQGMALDLADFGITVNAIGPGWVPVPNEGPCPSPLYEANCARTPLGRPGTTEEVGELAAFLVSDRAAWLTGQVIHLDGGLTCTLNMPSRLRDKALYGLD